jgi:hypothetical protein
MPTPSYVKLATATMLVKRSPAVTDDGKIAAPEVVAELLVTPPDTMDASWILGYGIQNPHSMWVVYYEGDFSFFKSDRLEIDNIEYNIRNLRIFPDYRDPANTSYEIVIEKPEQ